MPAEGIRRFEANDLRRFLGAVDAHLTSSAAIVVLGGSALALYGVPLGTMDIDTYETDLRPLEEAIARARETTGLHIPVSSAGVADAPYHYRDRLQPEQGAWARLTVLKLEPHDLALSKALRGNEHDLAGLEMLHRVTPLDLEVLVTRYLDEMGHAIGDRSRLDQNFLAMIERLYGEVNAERVEERVQLHRKRRLKGTRRSR